MSEINKRIKYLRKEELKLNQKKFAELIGMKQTSVSTFEQSGATVTEQTKTSICTVFNVSRKWLENGVEPIFNAGVDNQSFEIDTFARTLGATNLEIEILKAYFDLDKEVRETVIEHFKKYFNIKNKEDEDKEKSYKQGDLFLEDLRANEKGKSY